MSRWKNLRQSNWLIELSPRKIIEPRIVSRRAASTVSAEDDGEEEERAKISPARGLNSTVENLPQ